MFAFPIKYLHDCETFETFKSLFKLREKKYKKYIYDLLDEYNRKVSCNEKNTNQVEKKKWYLKK